MFWPLMENVLTENDLLVLTKFIMQTKRFTQFERVREFEARYSLWQGCQYSVFVNSGSSANLILLSATSELFNWQKGDEVIVPSVTWTTTVTPVIQLGFKPVFVDINLNDLSLDYEQVISRITPRTRAIFCAHLLGFPADIERLKRTVANTNIVILEDCCETQGGYIGSSKVGNHGKGGTFSFYWGHHMTTVEGGMVCTDDEELYKLLLLKRSHGLARELPERYHTAIKQAYPEIDFKFLFLTDGFNVRNTELSAVLGIEQLKKIDDYIAIRNQNYRTFLEACSHYRDVLITIDRPGVSSFVLPFFFKDNDKKRRFQDFISRAGIETRPLISGNLLRQPFLANYMSEGEFTNAEFVHENAFYIGNNQFVDKERLDKLFTLMNESFGHA